MYKSAKRQVGNKSHPQGMISHYSLEDVIGKKKTGRSDEHGEKHLAGSGGTYENAIP